MLLLDIIKEECKNYDYQVIFVSEQVNILYLPSKDVIVCQLNADINITLFKEAILKMGEFIKQHQVKNLVMDKRNMVTLHLPSMQWFYLSWMEQMYKDGLTTFHKILPNNELFKFSLQMGKDKIVADNPQVDPAKVETHYYKNLHEVLQNL
ncbi:hypothetical protein [Microscilla marina]|uniref:STAS domain-containing protein n=1 Tax=Microscilla marina ATCC 23134 TaxID=313606 RepID=A1ZCH1_MICM2|nr:hypothetical protein [Microscilla marina]EAY31973.1 hypothetical protein M23134_02002 [Microscilla marina ATCC 23134]